MENDVLFCVISEDPVKIIRPGEEELATLRLTNTGKDYIHGTLRLGVRRRSDEPIKLINEQMVSVESGDYCDLPIPADFIKEFGIYYLDWALTANGSWHGTTSFAYMNVVGVTEDLQYGSLLGGDEFIFGIAGGIRPFFDYGFKMRFLKAAALIGCKAYRMDMVWSQLQPEPDNEIRWTGLDETVDLAHQYGMFIQPLLGYGNGWATSKENIQLAEKRSREGEMNQEIWRYPPQLEPWGNFCRELAKRYGKRMQYYEVWNEPDIFFFNGTAAEYVDLLKTSYREIKSVDNDIIVTTGGFTYIDNSKLDLDPFPHGMDLRKFPELKHDFHLLTFSEGRESFDVLAWHRHGDFVDYQKEIDKMLLPLLAEKGLAERPIVFNETAVARDFDQEWGLATELVKKMVFSWARGAIGHYWYNLARSHPKFTMVNDDWTPRPSYPAYNELARQLRGRKYSHELALGEGYWGFVFHGKGDFNGEGNEDWVLVSWNENGETAEKEYMFQVSPESRAYRVDIMGNRREISVLDSGVITLQVEQQPYYLVIEGSKIKPLLLKN